MSSYLADHADICFAQPKEPLFFCDDMPNMRYVSNENDYITQCFGHGIGRSYTAVGEGSVWYLYSETAIPNILKFNPNAKFIVMIRNPLEMLASLHQKLYLFLDEDQPDFACAWRLQEKRRAGLFIGDHCREPKLLQYAEIGRLGFQLQRAFELIPASQRMVIRYEDFNEKTQAVYQRTLDFLGVKDDGRSHFPRVNENQKLRSRYLLEKAWHPPSWALALLTQLKKPFGVERINLLSKIRTKLVTADSRPELDRDVKEEILLTLSQDIDLLSELIGCDLSHWRTAES
jgi:sulfotransferase family protein